MNKPLSWIHLSRFRNLYSRATTIFLLLTLLSLSYIVEHSVLFDQDGTELLEGSEKEAEKKDKKLFVVALESSGCPWGCVDMLHLRRASSCVLHGIDIEVQTPPPRILLIS